MKIIDEKGRLFGKINIVDCSIMVIIVVIIPAFFYIHKILGKTPMRLPSKWIKVEVMTFTLPEIAKLMKEGDFSYDQYGNVDGKLVRVLAKDAAYFNHFKNAVIDRYIMDRIIKQYPLPGDKNIFIDTRFEYLIPVFLELELLCGRSADGEPWYFRREPLVITLYEYIDFNSNKYGVKCHVLKIKD